jgi:hypothetical protein
MYLERFRDLMLGSSTLLEEVDGDQKIDGEQKKVQVDTMAKRVRGVLRDVIQQNEDHSVDEEHRLVEATNEVRAGHINGLFHKTCTESLLELYEGADLEVDPGQLSRFTRERDKVVHSSWGSGLEETLGTPSYRVRSEPLEDAVAAPF